ncbi:AbrB family transcriptional regulator [Palleronia caenipelagi]|nr:AbrB family transcriptional regulator [Palleronia caenipelagi]
MRHTLTLIAGFAGAALAVALGLPVGALIGAALATGALTAMGRHLEVSKLVRDLGFCLIGVTLGSGIGPDFGADLVRWAPSIAMLILNTVLILWLGTSILRRRAGLNPEIALLAATPGSLSTVMALTSESREDVRPVFVLQSMRIFLVVFLVPPVTFLLQPPVPPDVSAQMGWVWLTLIVAIALPLGRGLSGLPAGCLLSGMVLSGLAHATGLTDGRPPEIASFSGMAIAGTVLGARLSGLSLRDLKGLATVTFVLLATTLVLTLAMVVLTSLMFGYNMGALWVAFAPGGIEAMAAIGVALGYDPAFIAVHHLSRILFLTLGIPFLMIRLRGR